MDTKERSSLAKELEPLSGWQIAQRLRIEYFGDLNPINHGGLFFSTKDWECFGCADCVEFWEDPETGHLMVSQGTIDKPDDVKRAIDDAGLEDPDYESIPLQIECARMWNGIEKDYYHCTNAYDLDTWKEWRIWRSVLPWLLNLQ